MISQNRVKQIQSLKTKKGRKKENLFMIEGVRCVQSYLKKSKLIKELFISETFVKTNKKFLKSCEKYNTAYSIVTDKDMKNISDTKTPSGITGICAFKPNPGLDFESKRWLYLYEISDPGNLGSLLRSAAWFNIKNIALSKNSADPFNPKVIRSATGAHIYLNIHQDIEYEIFLDHGYCSIGTDQNGTQKIEDLDYDLKLVLILGSEARGLDTSVKKRLNKIISIEKLGYGESLNVAIAGSILMNGIAKK
tara:strand:- start:2823 stop:3572 length:750 start_codon:yes stop_codon:yes gene_type:complete